MTSFLDTLLLRGRHPCPWWACFTFDNFLRRMVHKPEEILQPYITHGMKILDVGPGMGFFTIPLARMAGEKGHVVAADVQPQMLHRIMKRAEKAGLADRITPHLCREKAMELHEHFDFALAFWMVHEVPGQEGFFQELYALLKPSGKLLISEPTIHVTQKMFFKSMEVAADNGFRVLEHPKIFMSRSSLLGIT